MTKENKMSKKTNSILTKLLENSDTAKLIEETFESDDFIPTDVPILNAALSGEINGGLVPGITTIAGPSKHFKTLFGLKMAKAYLDKYEDSVIMIFDSEGGTNKQYFDFIGLDISRIIYENVTDIEDLKFKMFQLLEKIEKGEHVLILIDSIGNLASKKESKDAEAQNSAADMTRAKEIKSFGRLMNIRTKMKKIPCVIINHTYKTLEMYSKDVVGGGTGIMYSSDVVWIIGRNQEKNEETKEIEGYKFNIKIEKSRFIKEKSEFPIRVSFEHGILKWSGLSDLASEFGLIEEIRISRKKGYSYTNKKNEKIEILDELIDSDDKFWNMIISETNLNELIQKRYKLTFIKEESK